MFFVVGSSAASSKRDLNVPYWILLMESAPHGLAQQLYLDWSQQENHNVAGYMKIKVRPPEDLETTLGISFF